MYIIIFENQEIQLPEYSFDIAEKLEKTDEINNSSRKFKDKCRAVYDFEKMLLPNIEEILGEFEKCDPNNIQLLWMGIADCYNQPIIEKRREQVEATMNGYDFSKVTRLAETMGKLK